MSDDRHRRARAQLRAIGGHLRVVAPRALWLPFLVCLILGWGYFGFLRMRFGLFGVRFSPFGEPIVCLNAALLGAYRAIVFHPRWDSSYHEWLSRTPWTAAQPPPRGPIKLVWVDGLVVVALILAGAFAADLAPVSIINFYLFAYCAATACLTLATMTFVPAYAACFCLGLMARFWLDPWICFGFGVAAYLVVYWGIRRSLKSFPWSVPMEFVTLWAGFVQALGGSKTSKLGWPHERLLVDPTRGANRRTFAAHSLIACALIAWWISCLSSASAIQPADFRVLTRFLGYAVAFFGSLTRIGVYFSGYAPPISLAGRIAARRLVVPGFDQALLVFPLTFLAPETVAQIGGALGLSPMVYGSIIPPLVLFIVLAAPPGLRQWRLTGRHRMTAAIVSQNTNFVKVG